MTRSTLTDRYVWTVTRHLSAETGPDVAQELRASIGDAIDDKVAAGCDAGTAEREAVSEMGDPDVLARQYGGRPAYLIGPDIYPSWLRLMRVLFPIVLPLALVGNIIAKTTTSDESLGQIVLEAFLLLLSVAVHLAFWVTVSFALVEWSRPDSDRGRPLTEWTPDQLTVEVPAGGVSRWEAGFEVVLGLALAALVAWQVTGVWESGIQVLDPGMAPVWKVTLVAFFLLDAALAAAVWRAGRWTPGMAAVNVTSNAAAVLLLLWLLAHDRLLTDLPAVLGEKFEIPTDWSTPTGLIAAGIVLIAGWDAIGAIIKARRAARGVRNQIRP